MKDNHEFDKIALAIACSIFVLILSNAIGGFLYRVRHFPDKPGFIVDLSELQSANEGDKAKGIPAVIDIGQIMSSANSEAGSKIFNKCAICHTSGKGEPNKVGPNLWGIVGAKTARHTDFEYSPAMKQRASEGKEWTYEELYRYIYSPRSYVSGTKMAFAGLKNDQERANLIAFLRTQADLPLPLPAPLPASAPTVTAGSAKH